VTVSRIFAGFSAAPAPLADTVRSATARIDTIPDVNVGTWEDLSIGGRLLLDTIEQAITAADLSIFDLTQLNENVLFEFGFAVGSNRIVWPLRDSSDTSRETDWNTLGLLDTVGQVRFTNSEQIYIAFQNERPDLQGAPLFSTTLVPQLSGGRLPAIFYVAELHQTDAGRRVTTLLEKRAGADLPLVVADPQEASVQTLAWFTQQIYSAEAVIVHLVSTRRQGARAHNARASTVAGLARGMGKPLLMLAEQDYESALDYRDLLFQYSTAEECQTRLKYWLERELHPTEARLAIAKEEAHALRLSTELGSVDLGEYVAENEARALERYYVETTTYREVLSGDSRVYVGSKGVGKSATVLRAEAAIRADKRNLGCLIKPAGYDLNGLVRLLSDYEERDAKGYVAESLWKYLLLTELALSVEQDLATRPAGVMPDGPEWALLRFIADNADWLKVDFASRLELAVDRLLETRDATKLSDQRQRIAEALHAGPLRQLRSVLAPALALRRRVFVVIDNLDKAWDRGADVVQLSRLTLGLISSMDSFRHDLERVTEGSGAPISLSLFMRSDIFASVASIAREPDKLPVRRIRWHEEVPLLEIVDRRYAASRDAEPTSGELWDRYFCPAVGGRNTREWILHVCLPRPRDVLYLCKAAIDQAVARHHARVEQDDLVAAERQYSLFAFEAAAVEGQSRIADIDNVLLEFAGVTADLEMSQLQEVLRAGGIDAGDFDGVIDALRDLSFLGLHTADGTVMFTDSPREKQRADVLARRLAKKADTEVRYGIHPAFWAYLEMERGAVTLSLGL